MFSKNVPNIRNLPNYYFYPSLILSSPLISFLHTKNILLPFSDAAICNTKHYFSLTAFKKL